MRTELCEFTDGPCQVRSVCALFGEIFLLLTGEKALEVWHPSAPGYLA